MRYLRSQIWEILTCTAASAGLALNFYAGFYLPQALTAAWPLTALIALAVTVLLTLAAYSLRTTLAGLAVAAAAVIAVVLWARSGGILETDVLSTHPLLFAALAVLAPVVVFLLGRTRLGLVILFLGGSVLCAAFYFLQYPVSLPGCLAFVGGTALLYLQRVYSVSLMGAGSGAVKIGACFAQSVLAVVLAVALAAGIYGAVIRPLDPPTDDLKLITRLLSLDILERIGISSKTIVTTEEELSQILKEENQTTRDQPEEPEESAPQPSEELQPPDDLQSVTGNELEDARALSYRAPSLIPLIIVLILAAVILPPCLKLWRRRAWYRKLLAGPRDAGAVRLYLRMLRGLGRAGLPRPPTLTLSQYAANNRADLASFAVDGTDFTRLTGLYTALVYGGRPLTQEEFDSFCGCYGGFYRALRKKMGLFSYLLRFYTL